jgi:hypothetical protein
MDDNDDIIYDKKVSIMILVTLLRAVFTRAVVEKNIHFNRILRGSGP